MMLIVAGASPLRSGASASSFGGSDVMRRCQQLLATFAPAVAAVQQDPRQMLVWYPLAQDEPEGCFPMRSEQIDRGRWRSISVHQGAVEAAHARWTSEWLAWERAHDAEYRVKAAEVQDEIDRTPGQASPLLRTRLAAIEQQKLERYQQRYEEYIKTAKALAAFSE